MSTITTTSDIEHAIRHDRRFTDYEIVKVSEESIELNKAGQAMLLATPVLWRDEKKIHLGLTKFSGLPFLLVCLGRQEELEEVIRQRHLTPATCLLLPTSAVIMHITLETELKSLEHLHRAEMIGQEAERYRFELGEIIAIATAINSERDINRLLSLILEKSRYITGADAGSIYVVMPHPEKPAERQLRFEVAQNDSLVVNLKSFTLDVSTRSIVGAAVLTREVINIPDSYELDRINPWGIEHDRSFDLRTGYQTRSILAVPLITQRDEVVGVLQLINKKRSPRLPLATPDDFKQIIPFDPRSVELCRTLAYQAAISLENALLYNELRQVFEGFVEASVLAIESRDPTTSGHSRRVADLTVNLAEIVDRTDEEPYGETHFSPDALKEIEYAGLLHDFGKIGVPEPVLVKAHKLYEPELQLLVARFDYIRQWLRAETLRKKMELIKRGGAEDHFQALEEALFKQEQYLDFCIQAINQANQPTILDAECSTFLQEIAQQTYLDAQGETRPYLAPHELQCLQIKRGSLNNEERQQIESHVVHTFRFLCMIPWGRSFQRIAHIAGNHHEKLDGTGYPHQKTADEIPIQAKMMAIADIFDALTASDRPYKRAVPCERALDILQKEVAAQKLDEHLFRLFLQAKVYQRVLKPESP